MVETQLRNFTDVFINGIRQSEPIPNTRTIFDIEATGPQNDAEKALYYSYAGQAFLTNFGNSSTISELNNTGVPLSATQVQKILNPQQTNQTLPNTDTSHTMAPTVSSPVKIGSGLLIVGGLIAAFLFFSNR